MNYYNVQLDGKNYRVSAFSPAHAHRAARDAMIDEHARMLGKLNNEKAKNLYFSKHRAALVGPRTALVVLVGRTAV